MADTARLTVTNSLSPHLLPGFSDRPGDSFTNL